MFFVISDGQWNVEKIPNAHSCVSFTLFFHLHYFYCILSGQNRQKKGVRFINSALKNTVPYCQKCTPTDCDFAHWVMFGCI